jgi:transposase
LHLPGRAERGVVCHLVAKDDAASQKPVHLVVNGPPAHKTALAKDYVASTKGILSMHFLPGYAPDLNPDELVWSHMSVPGWRVRRCGGARN